MPAPLYTAAAAHALHAKRRCLVAAAAAAQQVQQQVAVGTVQLTLLLLLLWLHAADEVSRQLGLSCICSRRRRFPHICGAAPAVSVVCAAPVWLPDAGVVAGRSIQLRPLVVVLLRLQLLLLVPRRRRRQR